MTRGRSQTRVCERERENFFFLYRAQYFNFTLLSFRGKALHFSGKKDSNIVVTSFYLRIYF